MGVIKEVQFDMNKIKEVALKVMKEGGYKTFKVETKRSDKRGDFVE